MNVEKPKVAVLLAAYDGEVWIEAQLATIVHQLGVEVDVYVSVDLSTDGTISLVNKMQLDSPFIHTLTYGERYGAAGKNFFRLIRDVELSKYQYIAFADQDDIWFPDKLAFAIRQIKLAGVDAYSSDVLAFWEDWRVRLIKKSFPQKKLDFLYEAAGAGCTYVITATGMSYFKEFLIRNWDAVNDIALHDWLIYASLRAGGFKWVIDSVPLMLYRQHSRNQMGANVGLKSYVRRISRIKDKWYRGEVEKIAKILNLEVPTSGFILKNYFQLRRRTRDALALLALVLFKLY